MEKFQKLAINLVEEHNSSIYIEKYRRNKKLFH